MTPIHTQLQNEAGRVQLSRTERTHIREGLLEYMAYKPMRDSVAPQRAQRGGFGAFFRAHHFVGALAIALIVTTSTVSVGSAAADSLPGDLLYPVKVHVNEGVKTVFITGDEARIAWEQERAENRLQEATQLAVEGRLDGKRKEEVEKRFVAHSEALVEQVRNVEESDPVLAAMASSEFEESLETHEVILSRVADEQTEESQESVRAIAEQVHVAAQHAVLVREAAEEKIVRELEAQAGEETEAGIAEEEEVEGASEDEASGVATEAVVADGGDSTTDEQVAAEPQSLTYTAPKSRSPDSRIRTAYRAQERAQEQLERAQELLASLDEASELRTPARAQLASGNTHLADAEAALAEDDYSTAYRAYRSAAVKFQKVAELLEVSELFSIEVFTIAGEEELGAAELEAVAAFVDVPVINEIPNGEPQDTVAMRAQIQQALKEAQRLLLVHEGYEEDDLETAYSQLARSERSLLRGDIYRALDDPRIAARFYGEAQRDAEMTLSLLEEVLDSETVQEVPQLAPQEGGDISAAGKNQAATTDASTTVQIMHTVEEGVHVFVGQLAVATSCTEVAATLLTAESYPEQITLALTTGEYVDGCDVPSPQAPFIASTTASSEAVLMSVSVNDVAVPFELLETEGAEAVSNSEMVVPGPGASFMEQTFEQAQRLFGGE